MLGVLLLACGGSAVDSGDRADVAPCVEGRARVDVCLDAEGRHQVVAWPLGDLAITTLLDAPGCVEMVLPAGRWDISANGPTGCYEPPVIEVASCDEVRVDLTAYPELCPIGG